MKLKLSLLALLVAILVSCTQKPSVEPQFFDNYISSKAINESLLLAGKWLLDNQNANGSLTYKYFPELGRFSSANNAIRQFMATIALHEMYLHTGDARYKIAFENNLAYNLEQYYFHDGTVGHIHMDNSSKLGAAAFAAIALLKSNAPYESELQGLIDLILLLHNESDGSFRTFYIPKARNDNQYFYPGEAMVALMTLYEETGDQLYLEMVKQSYSYYMNYYQERYNPAMVPWMTISGYKLYSHAANATYREYIFTINNRLILMQNANCSSGAIGEFYDAKHPEYGPPHASSTGIYIEGLSYAFELARQTNDVERMQTYGQAMVIGARSLIELQFRDEDITNRNDTEQVHGGIRTTLKRPEIRIDNNQHAIMAFTRILSVMSDSELQQYANKAIESLCM